MISFVKNWNSMDSEAIFNMLSNIFSNREQFVTINGFNSSKAEIKYGTSIYTGTIAFLLYINDFRFSLKHAVSYFADNTSIIYASKKLKTIDSSMNHD